MPGGGRARHYILNQEAGYGVLQGVMESLLNMCLNGGVGGRGERVFRRFTGGPDYHGDDLLYIGILYPGMDGLGRVYNELGTILEHVGVGHGDGRLDVGGVYGVTRFGDVVHGWGTRLGVVM